MGRHPRECGGWSGMGIWLEHGPPEPASELRLDRTGRLLPKGLLTWEARIALSAMCQALMGRRRVRMTSTTEMEQRGKAQTVLGPWI